MNPRHAVWAEFMPYAWLHGDLKRLAQYNLQLNIAVQYADWNSPELKQLLAAAHAHQVPIGAWLLLPDAQGYWPNAENAQYFSDHAQRFLDWLEAEHLHIRELIVDMETPLALSRLLKGRLLQGLHFEYKRWLNPKSHEGFWQSVDIFTQLVQKAHDRGLKIQVVTYPMIVHDALKQSTALQEFLQIPVTMIPWDEISLMVYRSSFQDFLPFRISSGMVYRYIQQATQVLDTPVSAALGVIGSIGKLSESGFSNPDEIRVDIAAAQAAKAMRIQLFSLDGMHQLGAPEDWLKLLKTDPTRPELPPTPALPGDLMLWQSLNRSQGLLHRAYQWLSAAKKSPKS